MAGDIFGKVSPGSPFRFPAELYNRLTEVARGVDLDNSGAVGSLFSQSGIILVRNDSGADVGRFGVLGIDGPIVGPAEDDMEFRRQVALSGVAPVLADHAGKFVITLEPIAQGAIGRGIVDGIVPVRLKVSAAVPQDWAEVEDGQTGTLRNAGTGSAWVLWVEDSGDSEQWAVVRLEVPRAAGTEHRLGFPPVLAVCFNLPAYTRSSNTITATSNGAIPTQDGITLQAGDRILFVKDFGASVSADNGIYTVTAVGDASNKFILDRANDASTSGDFVDGYLVRAGSYGTNNAWTTWRLRTHNAVHTNFTLNTDSIAFHLIDWVKFATVYCVARTLPANTISSGDSYQTLTATANGALPAIDGLTLSTGHLLLYAPASAETGTSGDNKAGVWKVTQVGDASHPFILTRPGNADIGEKLSSGQIEVNGGLGPGAGTLYDKTVWLEVLGLSDAGQSAVSQGRSYRRISNDKAYATRASALNTTYQPGDFECMVVASVSIQTTGPGDSGKVELLADSASPPTTVRCTVSSDGAANGTGTIGGVLTAMLKQSWYYQLKTTTVGGTPTFNVVGNVQEILT